jgi:ABC-type transport system substrate-binding protein
VVWTIVHEGDDREHKVTIYTNTNWARGFDVIVHNECFGFVKDGDRYLPFPQIGKVIIEDNVEHFVKYDGTGGNNDPDILNFVFHSMMFPPNGANRGRYSNPEVDRLIVDARENFDEARVRADYQKAQEILWSDCPWIWLYEQPDITAINKRLKGFVGRRDEYLMFWDAALDS